MYAIGVDVGGTTVKLGCVKDGLHIVYREKRQSPRDPQMMAQTIFSMVSIAQQRYPGVKVGISCAGSMDSNGQVTANHLGWVSVPLGAMIYELFNRPIPMENDAMCALAAEHIYGTLNGCTTGILITLGTGIGGGIIVGGVPARGNMGLHGEVGHMITHADGRRCNCGQQGCWEMYAAASKLREAAGGMSVREVMSNVRAGKLLDIWGNYIHEVVIGLSSLMMIFIPEIIAIGGGLSNAGDIVINAIRSELEETSAFRIFNPTCRIVSAHFQNDAGILGAAALASMME
ncbi:MAG: ROK family protein [Clostridiales bacterium]|nr:ROK family protein [Clostridiales bacterium]